MMDLAFYQYILSFKQGHQQQDHNIQIYNIKGED
jgi:hypothetical protein